MLDEVVDEVVHERSGRSAPERTGLFSRAASSVGGMLSHVFGQSPDLAEEQVALGDIAAEVLAPGQAPPRRGYGVSGAWEPDVTAVEAGVSPSELVSAIPPVALPGPPVQPGAAAAVAPPTSIAAVPSQVEIMRQPPGAAVEGVAAPRIPRPDGIGEPIKAPLLPWNATDQEYERHVAADRVAGMAGPDDATRRMAQRSTTMGAPPPRPVTEPLPPPSAEEGVTSDLARDLAQAKLGMAPEVDPVSGARTGRYVPSQRAQMFRVRRDAELAEGPKYRAPETEAAMPMYEAISPATSRALEEQAVAEAEARRKGYVPARDLESVVIKIGETPRNELERLATRLKRAHDYAAKANALANLGRYLARKTDEAVGLNLEPFREPVEQLDPNSLLEGLVGVGGAFLAAAPLYGAGAKLGVEAARLALRPLAAKWIELGVASGLTVEEAAIAVEQALGTSRVAQALLRPGAASRVAGYAGPSVRAGQHAAGGLGAVGVADIVGEAAKQLSEEGKITAPVEVAKRGALGAATGALGGVLTGAMDPGALKLLADTGYWGLIAPLVQHGQTPTMENLIVAGVPAALLHLANKAAGAQRIEVLPAGRPWPRGAPEAARVDGEPPAEPGRTEAPQGPRPPEPTPPTPAPPAVPRQAPVTWSGWQPGTSRIPAFPLWTLTEDIPGHPKGSTVGATALREAGYEAPAPPEAAPEATPAPPVAPAPEGPAEGEEEAPKAPEVPKVEAPAPAPPVVKPPAPSAQPPSVTPALASRAELFGDLTDAPTGSRLILVIPPQGKIGAQEAVYTLEGWGGWTSPNVVGGVQALGLVNLASGETWGAIRLERPGQETKHYVAERPAFNALLYQGRGATLEQVYGAANVKAGRGHPLVGPGDYYAFTERDAKRYGAVTNRIVSLSNPYVLTSDRQWFELLRAADARQLSSVDRAQGPTEAAAQKLQDYLVAQGHDGLVTRFPSAAEGDVSETGDVIKRVRESFEHSTVVKFPGPAAPAKPAEAPKVEPPPVRPPEPPPPPPVAPAAFTLPRDLAGAKPRFGYGSDNYTLDFESDLDKALFTVTQTLKNKRDADYMAALRTVYPDSEEQAIRDLGRAVKDRVKLLVKGQDASQPVRVPAIMRAPTAKPAPAPTPPAATLKVEPPAEGRPEGMTQAEMDRLFVVDGMAYRLRDEFVSPESRALREDLQTAIRRGAFPEEIKRREQLYRTARETDINLALDKIRAEEQPKTPAKAAPPVTQPPGPTLQPGQRQGALVPVSLEESHRLVGEIDRFLGGETLTALREDIEAFARVGERIDGATIDDNEPVRAEAERFRALIDEHLDSQTDEALRGQLEGLQAQLDGVISALTPDAKPPTSTAKPTPPSEHDQLVERAAARVRELSDISEATSLRVAERIVAAIEQGVFNTTLHPMNGHSRAVFTELTGIVLPKTLSGTRALFTGQPIPLVPLGATPAPPQPDVSAKPAPAPSALPPTPGAYEHADRLGLLFREFADRLGSGALPRDPRALRRLVADRLGMTEQALAADAAALDDVYDAIEAATNTWDRAGRDPAAPLHQRIVEAQGAEEALGNRTRTLELSKRQQFSTPFPIGEATAYALDLREGETVGEPTAGTGNLLVALPLDTNTLTNEIDPRRAETLRLQGYAPTTADYLAASFGGGETPAVVVMNPPWGRYSTQRYGKAIPQPYGLPVDVAERFVVAALRDVKQGGRVVAVMPTTILESPRFLRWLETEHTLRAVIQNPPGSYDTRGTGVDSVILVVDQGRTSDAPAALRGQAADWSDLARLVEPLANGGTHARTAPTKSAAGQPSGKPGRPTRPAPPGPTKPDVAGGRPEDTGTAPRVRGGGQPGGAPAPAPRPGPGAPVVAPGGRPGPATAPEAADTELPVGTPEGGGGVGVGGAGLGAGQEGQRFSYASAEEFEAATRSPIFAPVPLRVSPGRHPHPRLVVVTRSLAGAQLPPLTYALRGRIVADAYERGVISDQQLDYGVLPALQANEKRRGYLLAADVGVGKSRQAAAIIAEWLETGQAHRVVLIAPNEMNEDALLREFAEFTGGEFPFPIVRLRGMTESKERPGETRQPLPQHDRAVYLVDRNNFAAFAPALKDLEPDAVVADEAHLLKNVEGAKVGIAWLDFQNDLLRRRGKFVYMTATPAVEFDDLGQMVGLREWTYDTFEDYKRRVTGSGRPESVDALHQEWGRLRVLIEDTPGIPEDARAKALADGVYEPTSDEEEAIGRLTEAINVLRDVLLEHTNALDPTVKIGIRVPRQRRQASSTVFDVRITPAEQEQIMRELAIKGLYYSVDLWRAGVEFDISATPLTPDQQNEYRDLTDLFRDIAETWDRWSSMNQMNGARSFGVRGPLQAEAKRRLFDYRIAPAIEEGRVALARGEQVVFTLISVNPTQKDTGNITSIIKRINTQHVEVDDNGDAINLGEIPEAVQEIARLLDAWGQIRSLPDPIEMLESAFGKENVTVVTGQVSAKQRDRQIREFQAGQRRVAIISEAGTTGISLHHVLRGEGVASGRRHLIAMDYPWSSVSFKQLLGRVDRSGQISAPRITALSTGSAGERKFLATIANRMKSLGALSKGSAESASNDKLTEFEIGGSLDLDAMRQAYAEAPRHLQEAFIGNVWRVYLGNDPQTGAPVTENARHDPPAAAGLKDFLLDLQFMPQDLANQMFEGFWRTREAMIAEQQGEQETGRTASARATVVRSTPLARDLVLHELKDIQGHRFGLLQGLITPRIRVATPFLPTRSLGNRDIPMRQYMTVAIGEGHQVAGLRIRPGALQAIKRAFGKAEAEALDTPEKVLQALEAGDTVPLDTEHGWSLKRRPSDGLLSIIGAKMADQELLIRAGAKYRPVGNLWHVPKDTLADFLERFPAKRPEGEGGVDAARREASTSEGPTEPNALPRRLPGAPGARERAGGAPEGEGGGLRSEAALGRGGGVVPGAERAAGEPGRGELPAAELGGGEPGIVARQPRDEAGRFVAEERVPYVPDAEARRRGGRLLEAVRALPDTAQASQIVRALRAGGVSEQALEASGLQGFLKFREGRRVSRDEIGHFLQAPESVVPDLAEVGRVLTAPDYETWATKMAVLVGEWARPHLPTTWAHMRGDTTPAEPASGAIDAEAGTLREIEGLVTDAAPGATVQVGDETFTRRPNAIFPWVPAEQGGQPLSTPTLLGRIRSRRASLGYAPGPTAPPVAAPGAAAPAVGPGSPASFKLMSRIAEIMDIPVRIGRMRQPRGVLGIFKAPPPVPGGKVPDVIRLRTAEDIQTLAHEVGHYVSRLLWGSQWPGRRPSPSQLARRAFYRTHEAELMALAQTHRKPSTEEGFAEFWRLYLTREAQARTSAPTLYGVLEAEVGRHDPALLAALRNIRDWYVAWRSMEPSERVRAHIMSSREVDRQREDARLDMFSIVEQAMDRYAKVFAATEAMTKGAALPAERDPRILIRALSGAPRLVDLFLFKGRTNLPEVFVKMFGASKGGGGALDFATRRRAGPSLEEALEPVRTRVDDWKVYMIARRVQELFRRKDDRAVRQRESLMRVWEMQESDVDGIVAKYDGPEFRQAHDTYQEWNRAVLAYVRDSGLLAGEVTVRDPAGGPSRTMSLYDLITDLNQSHFPFHRFFEERADIGIPAGGKLTNVQQPVRAMKGSGRLFLDPLDTAVRNLYVMVMSAERHAVVRAFVDLAERTEGGGRWFERVPPESRATSFPVEEIRRQLEAAGVDPDALNNADLEAVLRVFRPDAYKTRENEEWVIGPEGRPVHYIVEPNLHRALTGMNVGDVSWLDGALSQLPAPGFRQLLSIFREGEVGKGLKGTALNRELWKALLFGPARLRRAGATLAPEFQGRNVLRDTFDRAMLSQVTAKGKVPVVWPWVDLVRAIAGVPKGLLSAIQHDEWYEARLRGGGEIASLPSLDLYDIQRRIDDVLTGRDGADWHTVYHPVQLARLIGATLEDVNRIAETRDVMEARGQRGTTASKSEMLVGGTASREGTVDFNMIGAMTKRLAINRLAAFYNASIQGNYRTYRAFRADPGRLSWFLLMTVTLPSLLLWWAEHDDPRWAEIPQWQKDNSWIYLTGAVTEAQYAKMSKDQRRALMRQTVWRVPKPWLPGVVFGSVPERILDWAYGHTPRTLVESLTQTLGVAASMSLIPTPTMLEPILDNLIDYMSFFGRPVEGRGMKEKEAGYRVRPHTSRVARWIAGGFDAANEVARSTAGTKPVPEMLRSPLQVDHILQSLGGGLERLGAEVVDWTVDFFDKNAPPKPERTWADIPGIRAFAVRFPTTQSESIDKFYDIYTDAQQAVNTYRPMVGPKKPKAGAPPVPERLAEQAEGYERRRAALLLVAPALATVAKTLGERRKEIQVIYDDKTKAPSIKRAEIEELVMDMIEAASDGVRQARDVERAVAAGAGSGRP